MNQCVVCLGSNTDGCDEIVKSVAETLARLAEQSEISSIYHGPSHTGIGADYANCIVAMSTSLTLRQITTIAAALEKEYGRTSESKVTGNMPLDADIVYWNGKALKPSDTALPHFTRGYDQIRPKIEAFCQTNISR